MATLAIEQINSLNATKTTTATTTEPIKIPLNKEERFSTQLSTGSADSACVVNSNNGNSANSSLFLNGSTSITSSKGQQKQDSQFLNIRSASLSLHGTTHPKCQLQKLKQPAYRQLLSQDSGIDNDRDSAIGSQQQLKSAHCSSSSSESIGANSSGDLSQSKYSEDNLDTETSSGYSGSAHSFGATRRIKYKSCNSSTTLGCLGLEDRIDEVDDLHDDDEDEDENEDELEEDENEDDDLDDAEMARSPILPQRKQHVDQQKKDSHDNVDGNEEDCGLQMSLNPHKSNPKETKHSTSLQNPHKLSKDNQQQQAQQKEQQVLATDGLYYFPLLNISDDPCINSKLINKKDGLQDCMYYLDEFGSPKLREKYARKQKQKELKQQIKALKKKREEAAAASTKKSIQQQKQHQQQQHQQQTQASKNSFETHCDTKENTRKCNFSYSKKSSSTADNSCKLQATTAAMTTTTTVAAEVAQEVIVADDETVKSAGGTEQKLKSTNTQSCVSWTKVVQKFKNIIGK